jgi:ribosome-binding protein aMBF1 (putative translation factor)
MPGKKNPELSAIDQFVIDKVRQMRKDRGISQKELSHLLDLSIGFIGDIESPKGRAKYNLKHINDLALIFECSPQELLPEKPIKKTKKK